MEVVLCIFVFLTFLCVWELSGYVKDTKVYVGNIANEKNRKEKALRHEEERKEKIETRLREVLSEVNTKDTDREFADVAFEALFNTFSWTTKDEWIYTLITEYPNYVVKEYGRDLEHVKRELSWLWRCKYKDILGLEYNYCEWAKMFNSEPAIDIYIRLLSDNNVNDNVIYSVSERYCNLYNNIEDFE